MWDLHFIRNLGLHMLNNIIVAKVSDTTKLHFIQLIVHKLYY